MHKDNSNNNDNSDHDNDDSSASLPLSVDAGNGNRVARRSASSPSNASFDYQSLPDNRLKFRNINVSGPLISVFSAGAPFNDAAALPGVSPCASPRAVHDEERRSYSCATCSLLVLLVVLDVSEISVTPTDVRTAAVRAPCRGTFSLADSQPVSAKKRKKKDRSLISHRTGGRGEKPEASVSDVSERLERVVAHVSTFRVPGGSIHPFECQHVPSRRNNWISSPTRCWRIRCRRRELYYE